MSLKSPELIRKRLRNDAVHEERSFNRKKVLLLIEGVRDLKLLSQGAADEIV